MLLLQPEPGSLINSTVDMKKTIFIIVLSVFCDAIQAQKKELVFATYAYSANNRLQNLEPLCRYLSVKTGICIKAVSYPTVPTLISALINDSVDFAMMNTSGYLVLQRNHPGKVLPLVNLDMGNDSFTNYGGCLIASKQSGISSIADLQKKPDKTALALVNVSSTSGNLVKSCQCTMLAHTEK
jgi:phosphonate transport system substrate-binding protein